MYYRSIYLLRREEMVPKNRSSAQSASWVSLFLRFQSMLIDKDLIYRYDGQGPEHSSARIERFLQLCDDHPAIYPSELALSRTTQDCNMQLVYPTTPVCHRPPF